MASIFFWCLFGASSVLYVHSAQSTERDSICQPTRDCSVSSELSSGSGCLFWLATKAASHSRLLQALRT